MPDPRPQGRMIRRDISRSKRIAALSPKATALFCLILPHLDSFGKANGDPGYVKAEMVPLIPWLTVSVIRKSLTEIDKETNLKWFKGEDGTWYLHAIKWDEHQALERAKRGTDRLPSYPSPRVEDKSTTTRPVVSEKSPTNRRAVAPEVEVKYKKEKEDEVPESRIAPVRGASAPAPTLKQVKGNGAGKKDSRTVPPRVEDAILRSPPDLRKSIKSLFEMVREGETAVDSARSSLAGRISVADLDIIFPAAVGEHQEGRALQ